MVSKDEEARHVAETRYAVEDGLSQVYRLIGPGTTEQDPKEPIKLLEVNADTIAAGIQPIGFPPAPKSGIHFSTIIVAITPDEYSQLRGESLSLPHGWTIGELIPRSCAVGPQ
jgi:hypothetical protein